MATVTVSPGSISTLLMKVSDAGKISHQGWITNPALVPGAGVSLKPACMSDVSPVSPSMPTHTDISVAGAIGATSDGTLNVPVTSEKVPLSSR